MKLAKLWKIFGWAIGIVTILYLAFVLSRDWNLLLEQELHPQYEILLFSFLIMLFYIPLIGVVWGFIVNRLGHKVSLFDAACVRTVGDMARYMPGKIWLVVGRLGVAQKEGIPRSIAFLALMIEIIANLVAGFMVFFIGFPFLNYANGIEWMKISYFIVPFGLFILHPRIFTRLINLALKFMKKEPRRFNLMYRDILIFVALYAMLWGINGFAFFLLSKSFYPLAWSLLLPFIAISAISWLGGFLSFIAPAGIGIREGIFTFLLSAYLPVPIAIIISLSTRIAMTMAEVITALALFKKKYMP